MELESTPGWRSERAELFLLHPDDASDDYLRWLQNPVVNRYLESRFHAHSLSSIREFIAVNRASPSSLFLGLRAPALAGRHVGNIKLAPIDPHHRSGEVGIVIGEPSAWGRGLATEAIRLLSGIAANQLGLRRLTAGCYESNAGSERAFLRAGFSREALRPGHFLLEGRPEGLLLLGKSLEPG
jgi:ribosomal-protein-alanine N-acetyltransferase